jgi:DNA-binding response OmpR family regulator
MWRGTPRSLPLLNQPLQACSHPGVVRTGPPEGGDDGRPLSVLVVDDYPDAAASLAALLALHGYAVRAADSVAAAWRAVLAETPDVAVLDIGLRDGSGYDLASELAALTGGGPVIVALSGYEPDPGQAATVGIARHFTKGRSLDELVTFLGTCVPAPTPR